MVTERRGKEEGVLEWMTVAAADDLAEGELMGTIVDGEDVVVAKVSGELRALGGACTHEGGPLSEGEIEDGTVMCPWHGSMFDLQTGQAVAPPATEGVAVYEVRVHAGDIQVRTPSRP
jgi:nitrite reductase/ring-hydroxylating ferredoxin subunit